MELIEKIFEQKGDAGDRSQKNPEEKNKDIQVDRELRSV